MPKTTEAQALALRVLDLDGEARISNVTSEKMRFIYWQTGRWLVNRGYAKVVGIDDGQETLGITPAGRREAAKS